MRNLEKKCTMKKYKTLFISIGIGIINHSINAQIKERKMEQFDYEKFIEIKNDKNNLTNSFYTSDGTKIEFVEFNDSYTKDVTLNNSKFMTRKLYFKDNLHLKYSGSYFQQIPIGIHIEYNEQGKIISETDCDTLYPFSLTTLSNL